jgi:hypothetical protein
VVGALGQVLRGVVAVALFLGRHTSCRPVTPRRNEAVASKANHPLRMARMYYTKNAH